MVVAVGAVGVEEALISVTHKLSSEASPSICPDAADAADDGPGTLAAVPSKRDGLSRLIRTLIVIDRTPPLTPPQPHLPPLCKQNLWTASPPQQLNR